MPFNYLAADQLKLRGVYEVHSRNIVWGVFDGTGFVGLRFKFEYRIDKEWLDHTVRGALRYICELPKEIELTQGWSSTDNKWIAPGYYMQNERLLGYLLRIQETEYETAWDAE